MPLTPEAIEARLQPIFARVFSEPGIAIRREMAAKDVARWDSLTHTEMLAEVERAFGVRFKLKEVLRFKNVGDMIDALAANPEAR